MISRKIKSRKVANAFIERVCDLALETREVRTIAANYSASDFNSSSDSEFLYSMGLL